LRLRCIGHRTSHVQCFTGGDLAGLPAVTRHRLGRGTAWYLATRPDPHTTRDLFDRVRQEAGVAPVLPGLPRGVHVRARGDHYIVLNHTTSPADVALPTPMRDDLTGTGPTRALRLPPHGVALLRPA
jgi:beta-galactosidase